MNIMLSGRSLAVSLVVLASAMLSHNAQANVDVPVASYCLDEDYGINSRGFNPFRKQHEDPERIVQGLTPLENAVKGYTAGQGCLEMRSRGYLLKKEFEVDLANKDTMRQIAKYAGCSYKELVFHGAKITEPFHKLLKRLRGLKKESECQITLGSHGDLVALHALEVNTLGKINNHCPGYSHADTGREDLPDDLGELAVKVCPDKRGNKDLATNLDQWNSMQQRIRWAREAERMKPVDRNKPVASTGPTVSSGICSARDYIDEDAPRYFKTKAEAAPECDYPAATWIKGPMHFVCTAKQSRGPHCGTFYARNADARRHCDYPTADHARATLRWYCPARHRKATYGDYYALEADAQSQCGDKRRRDFTGEYGTTFWCPRYLTPDDKGGGTVHKTMKAALQVCDGPDTKTLDGRPVYFCPPRQFTNSSGEVYFAKEADTRCPVNKTSTFDGAIMFSCR